jgi:hypothetical protein
MCRSCRAGDTARSAPNVPEGRTLVYDNLRRAVLERAGIAIRFHSRQLELAGHYHFAPRPCTPGRANEKGKIEHQIHYLPRPSSPHGPAPMSTI